MGHLGGAERVLLSMLTVLRSPHSSLKLHVILGEDGPLVERVRQLGVGVTVLPLPMTLQSLGDSGIRGWLGKLVLLGQGLYAMPDLWVYRQQLRQTLLTLQPALIHSNGIKTHLLTSLLGPLPCPVLWHIHDFYRSRPLMAYLLRWASNRATLGLAVSQSVADEALQTLPSLAIAVVPNRIDTQVFAPTANHPFPSLSVRVGLVATFARWKGQDIFLDAAAYLVRHYPHLSAQFYLVGEPIYQTQGSQFSMAEIRTRVEGLGLGDRVTLMGWQSDMPTVYRALDVVVHASTQPEPFGLAIAEAMACGKAVIAVPSGGAAEVFTPNMDAIAIPPGDAPALAEAIAYLIQHPDERQRLAENARCTVVKRFNLNSLYDQLWQVYQQVLLPP